MDSNDAAQQQLRQLPLIGWALALGATIFAAIAVGLPYFSPPAEGAVPVDGSALMALGAVHALMFVNALVLAKLLPPKLRARPNGAFSAQVVRWAVLEGAALLGVVVVLMAGLQGVVPGEPVHYAHLASLLWFWMVVWGDTRRLEKS